jgi:hypothetical protein
MLFSISLPRIETYPTDPVSHRRTLVYVPRYSDAQLTSLGATLQAQLGESFISFEAIDALAAHDINITWNEELLGVAAAVDIIDTVLNAFTAPAGTEGQS